MTVTLSELFSASGADGVARLESYKAAMAGAHAEAASGDLRYGPDINGHKVITKGYAARGAAHEKLAVIEKAFGAMDTSAPGYADLSSMLGELRGSIQEINKDWTPSNPISSGMVPYDLEAPAKFLVPLYTPLVNSMPRVKGQGNARQYKRITGITNSGQGVAEALPFFASGTQTSTWGGPGNLTLNRPAKISYSGDSFSVPYMELGFSDQVNWLAQYEGLGFDDLRARSHTAGLYAHKMGEERSLLYARGTASGYSGVVSAPSGITLGTATSGGTIPAATYYVYVKALTGTGESAPSTVASQATTGATSTISITVGTEPTGAIYYGLWVGTTTGIANAKYQGTFVGNAYTLTSYNASGASTTATDTSASALAYDGILTVQSNPANGGYFLRHNGPFSSVKPGYEIDQALTAMFVANGANPDEIYMTGAVRAAYNGLMRNGAGSGGAASGYRTNVTTGDGNAVMGTVVGGHMNPNTGKVLKVDTHRFMLPGAVLIRSTSLPIPQSEVPAPIAAVNVQDYMGIDWPVIQMTYDLSTYQIGTVCHYATAWHGLILGVQYSDTDGV